MICLITEKTKFVYYDLNILWEGQVFEESQTLPTAMLNNIRLENKIGNSILVLKECNS